MLVISMKSSIDEWRKTMTYHQREQIPFAASVALNNVAMAAAAEIKSQMAQRFENPTPWTLNSLYVRRSNKTRLYAEVRIKDESFKSNAPTQWLTPEVDGGGRPLKRFESALKRAGILPAGTYAVPGVGAKLDAYGNMSRGQIVQILSWFQAFGQQGYRSNITAKGKAKRASGAKAAYGTAFFALLQRRGRLRPGIYERLSFSRGSVVRPVLEFVRAPYYRKRLPFYETVDKLAQARLADEFRVALLHALDTAH